VKKKEIGVCSICDCEGILTYEHIPPKSAGNSKPKLVKGHEHLFEEKSYLFGKTKKLNKGFGKNCLCESCNNFLGANYVNDYVEFVNQCMEQYNTTPSFENFKIYKFHIKPLNVFKQIFSMFVCLNQEVFSVDEKKLIKDFLLCKENKVFLENYNIYVFNTFSKFDKWCGFQVARNNIGELNRCSEIAYKPFGFQMTFDSYPTNQFFQILNRFTNFDIDQKVEIEIAIPRYDINNVFVGQ
jgi:hypothetical protein